MSQTFDAIPDTDSLTASRQKLLDRDEAVRSCFSGANAPSSPVLGQLWFDSDDTRVYQCVNATGPVWRELTQEVLSYALSDESTAITVGNGKITVRAPWACKLVGIRASLSVASTSGVVTVDVNVAGATILSTKLTIDASEKTSVTAAAAAVISTTTIADDAEITFDIDTAGTGAKGLKVTLYVYRT